MRVVVDTADEARLAIASGADRILLRLTPREGQPGLDRLPDVKAALGKTCPVSVLFGPERVDAPSQAVADEWFIADRRRNEADAPRVPTSFGRTIAVLPASVEAITGVLDDLVQGEFHGILIGGIAESHRLLTLTPVGVLQQQINLARARGLDVSVGGHLDVPDIPRLLAIDPDEILLDAIARERGDASAPLDPERLRLLRALIPLAPAVAERDAPPPSGDCDRIFLRDWTIPISIGAYAHEHEPQRVRFSVEVDVTRHVGRPSDLRHVVSYDLIVDAIGRTTVHHVDLVETLAEDIARAVLAHPRVARVEVTVEKLDLGPGSLGCRIVRTRDLRDQRPPC